MAKTFGRDEQANTNTTRSNTTTDRSKGMRWHTAKSAVHSRKHHARIEHTKELGQGAADLHSGGSV